MEKCVDTKNYYVKIRINLMKDKQAKQITNIISPIIQGSFGL